MANKKVKTDTIKVRGFKEFQKKSEELRKMGAGYTALPGVFGAGSNSPKLQHYEDYLQSKLMCGEGPEKNLPLLHVSACSAQPVKAENGHQGEFITWGWGNQLPNVVGMLSSLLPYTAAGHRFNKNLMAGLGVKPIYKYVQYVGGNITEKRIDFDSAGTMLQGRIRDLQREKMNIEDDLSNTAKSMMADLDEQIATLREDLAVWKQTKLELDDFLRHNNPSKTFLDMSGDMDLFDLAYAEIQLNQQQIDPKTKGKVSTNMWKPKVTGIRYRDCHTIRLERRSEEDGLIHNVFISNSWLDASQQAGNVTTVKYDSLPTISMQSPVIDLESSVGKARLNKVSESARPTRFILPIIYSTTGRPYYPIPAWYSVFSGDVYLYASVLIADRAQRRKNANVIGRVIYLSDEYMQRLYMQREATTPEKKKELFNTVIKEINEFLKNRENMGEPLVAYTFIGADGKPYKSWEIVEIESNNKNTADANQTELAEVSSIILFAKGLDSQLIGNTPGTTTRSGGTDLRERYLLKEVQASPTVQLLLSPYRIAAQFNKWDGHLDFEIRRMTLTTLDNSKTGVVESGEE